MLCTAHRYHQQDYQLKLVTSVEKAMLYNSVVQTTSAQIKSCFSKELLTQLTDMAFSTVPMQILCNFLLHG